jgi:hypothetical protein
MLRAPKSAKGAGGNKYMSSDEMPDELMAKVIICKVCGIFHDGDQTDPEVVAWIRSRMEAS